MCIFGESKRGWGGSAGLWESVQTVQRPELWLLPWQPLQHHLMYGARQHTKTSRGMLSNYLSGHNGHVVTIILQKIV